MNHRLSFACIVLVTCSTIVRGQHCETVLVSQSSAGTQGGAVDYFGRPVSSVDGRYVAFSSRMIGLVPDDPTPGVADRGDVYVRDVLAGTIERVEFGTQGEAPDLPGTPTGVVSISADGRYVAFDSYATNMDPTVPDTNGFMDVYVRDRVTGTTVRASSAADGSQANEHSGAPTLSADGRYVVFLSAASNLVVGDTFPGRDVFVKDLVTGAVDLVSSDSNDLQGDATDDWGNPDISADGRYVVFTTYANLGAPHGNPQVLDAFVKDRVTRQIQLVSLSSWGEPANAYVSDVCISDDGNRVAFVSPATNLVIQGDVGLLRDVYLRDRTGGTTVRLTHPPSDPLGHANGGSYEVSISGDGRWVAFSSSAGNLVLPPVGPGPSEVYVYDTQTQVCERVSVPVTGTAGTSYSEWSTMARDARSVVFLAPIDYLVPGDTNDYDDIVQFRRDCLPPSSTPFCFGDGSGTACPCGNAGAAGNGCASSLHAAGANLRSTGLASVTTDTFTLRGSNLSSSVVTYFQGTQRVNGGLGAIFGDGLRCAGGTTIRLGAVSSPGGVSRYPNAGEPLISVKGAIPVGGGVTRTYQCWYRNAADFCTSATFNLTNGLDTTWVP